MSKIFLLAAALLIFTACRAGLAPANGWGIVAVDPQTGDVGVAGASCSEYPFDTRAVLLPDKGAGLVLGVASTLQRDRFGAWMESRMDAPTMVAKLTTRANDNDAAVRQYAIVTVHDGRAQAAGFVGADNAPEAKSVQAANGAVIVGGSGMANPQLPDAALAAFQEQPDAPLALSDRLMRALAAGSAAGGSALCSQKGVTQTASSAFILLARHGDPPFRVNMRGNSAPQESNPPWLALSVTTPSGGKNAVRVLREQYDAWRQKNLPPCSECTRDPVALSEGGAVETTDWFERNALWLVALFTLAVMGATIAWFALRPHSGHTVHETPATD